MEKSGQELLDRVKKELVKRGLTQEEAQKTLNESKLSDDELKILLQESEDYKEEIVAVELEKVPALLEECYKIKVEIGRESQKLAKVMQGTWFDEYVTKHFKPIKNATDALNKEMGAKLNSLTSHETLEKLAKEKGKFFDAEEIKLENELALYRFKKEVFPKIDAKFKVTTEMRENFSKTLNKLHMSKAKPIELRIDELNSRASVLEATIAKTLFISIEEADLIVVSKNFFSTVFEFIKTVDNSLKIEKGDAFKIFKDIIAENHKTKQEEMKAKIAKLRAERKGN